MDVGSTVQLRSRSQVTHIHTNWCYVLPDAPAGQRTSRTVQAIAAAAAMAARRTKRRVMTAVFPVASKCVTRRSPRGRCLCATPSVTSRLVSRRCGTTTPIQMTQVQGCLVFGRINLPVLGTWWVRVGETTLINVEESCRGGSSFMQAVSWAACFFALGEEER